MKKLWEPIKAQMKARNMFHLGETKPVNMLRRIVVLMVMASVLTIVSASVDAVELITKNYESLQVDMHKGRLIRLKRAAKTVFVADPKIADIQVKSPRLVYVFGKKPGQTTLFAVDSKENVLANMNITVLHNLTQLRGAIRKLYPEGEIQVASVDGSVVIDGLVPTASMADDIRRLALNFVEKKEHLINRLCVTAPNQVNLRVRIAEVSRDVEKQLGFNWTVVGSLGGLALGVTTVNPFSINAVTQSLTSSVSQNVFGNQWDFNVLVDALEGEGLLSILAEPNLTAISGETASFLAGGEFPILVPEGDNRVVVQFKKFGVSLAFTPNVIGRNRINLHVRPEVSHLLTEGSVTIPVAVGTLTIPSLTTRRAETTVELESG